MPVGSPPNRQIKDLLGQLGHSLQDGASPGEDNPEAIRFPNPRPAHFVLHQREDLFDPGLDDFCQGLPGKNARFPSSDTGDFNGLVLPNHRGQAAAITNLDFLRFFQGVRRPMEISEVM